MKTAKEIAIDIVENLPDNVTLDDIIEVLYVKYVNQKIDIGIEQIEKGNFLTMEQVKKKMKKYLD